MNILQLMFATQSYSGVEVSIFHASFAKIAKLLFFALI